MVMYCAHAYTHCSINIPTYYGALYAGVHCNVNRLTIGQGITVQVAPYDGVDGGSFEVYAEVRLGTHCHCWPRSSVSD